jgi:hypothetical protein
MQDTDEPRCVLKEGMCYMKNSKNQLNRCGGGESAMFDRLYQSGRKCEAAQLEGGVFEIHVQLKDFDDEVKSSDGCPVVEVEVEVVDEKSVTVNEQEDCNLCYKHSCQEIEQLKFHDNEPNNFQATKIAFGFDVRRLHKRCTHTQQPHTFPTAHAQQL